MEIATQVILCIALSFYIGDKCGEWLHFLMTEVFVSRKTRLQSHSEIRR